MEHVESSGPKRPGLVRTWYWMAGPGLLACAAEICLRTWVPWTGSSITAFGIAHGAPLLLVISIVAVLLTWLWLTVCVTTSIFGANRRRHGSRWLVGLLVVTLLGVLVPWAPESVVESTFVLVVGPGQGAGQFLNIAASAESRVLTNAVLARGGAVDDVGLSGETALATAAPRGSPEFVSWLIARGANVNARNSEGYTPLMNAVSQRNRDVTALLIARGADVRAQTHSGRSVLDHALESEDPVIIAMVRAAIDGGPLPVK